MKEADSKRVHELGQTTDFRSWLSITSNGFWRRVHEVGSTSSGHKLRNVNNMGRILGLETADRGDRGRGGVTRSGLKLMEKENQ